MSLFLEDFSGRSNPPQGFQQPLQAQELFWGLGVKRDFKIHSVNSTELGCEGWQEELGVQQGSPAVWADGCWELSSPFPPLPGSRLLPSSLCQCWCSRCRGASLCRELIWLRTNCDSTGEEGRVGLWQQGLQGFDQLKLLASGSSEKVQKTVFVNK